MCREVTSRLLEADTTHYRFKIGVVCEIARNAADAELLLIMVTRRPSALRKRSNRRRHTRHIFSCHFSAVTCSSTVLYLEVSYRNGNITPEAQHVMLLSKNFAHETFPLQAAFRPRRATFGALYEIITLAYVDISASLSLSINVTYHKTLHNWNVMASHAAMNGTRWVIA